MFQKSSTRPLVTQIFRAGKSYVFSERDAGPLWAAKCPGNRTFFGWPHSHCHTHWITLLTMAKWLGRRFTAEFGQTDPFFFWTGGLCGGKLAAGFLTHPD